MCLIPLGDGLVCEIGHCLHHHAKVGVVYVPHGEKEVNYYKLCVTEGFIGDEEGEVWDILHLTHSLM